MHFLHFFAFQLQNLSSFCIFESASLRLFIRLHTGAGNLGPGSTRRSLQRLGYRAVGKCPDTPSDKKPILVDLKAESNEHVISKKYIYILVGGRDNQINDIISEWLISFNIQQIAQQSVSFYIHCLKDSVN